MCVCFQMFDAQAFGMSPAEIQATDPNHRVLLEQAFEAAVNSGQTRSSLMAAPVGVYVGLVYTDWNVLRSEQKGPPSVFGAHGCDPSSIGGRFSFLFGLKGPCMTINTACSSSLVALDTALSSISRGNLNGAVVSATNLHLHPNTWVVACAIGLPALDGRSKTFDISADAMGIPCLAPKLGLYLIICSTGFSEGCGAVMIAPDSGHSRLVASAVNQDGHSASFSAPNGLAQEAVLSMAVHSLDKQHELEVETHGTGNCQSRIFLVVLTLLHYRHSSG